MYPNARRRNGSYVYHMSKTAGGSLLYSVGVARQGHETPLGEIEILPVTQFC